VGHVIDQLNRHLVTKHILQDTIVITQQNTRIFEGRKNLEQMVKHVQNLMESNELMNVLD
jgi:hypothetical protein